MNVQDAYTSWSASYDAVPNPTRDLDREVMRRIFTGRRYARVLELGCGTGKNTALLAGIADQLVALDFSPGMLAIARRRLSDLRDPQVCFVQADITQPWPVDDGAFDLVTCNLVLEHVRDLAPVFVQARRCLAPCGKFFVSELHPAKQYLGSQARFEYQGGEQKIPATMHHLSDYTAVAAQCGLQLLELNEWWDEAAADQGTRGVQEAQPATAAPLGSPPRLVSLMFGGRPETCT